jgi:hypothetical protein
MTKQVPTNIRECLACKKLIKITDWKDHLRQEHQSKRTLYRSQGTISTKGDALSVKTS